MRLRRRARPREVVTQSTLDNAFDRRTFVIGTAMGGLGVLLATRMGYIAIAENERYELESESNRVNLSLIPPRRGWILDRNGAPLASNRADFRVDIIPERLQEPERELATLGRRLVETRLTQRQREVLEWSSAGKTVAEIGTILGVAAATVEKHLRLARQAIGADTTAHAILRAHLAHQIFPHGQDLNPFT